MHRHPLTHLFKAGLLGALALAGLSASAQSAGTLMFKLGVNQISPKVSSGDLSPPAMAGTQIDVDKATSLIATVGYMFTDHLSAEFYAGLGYKHDVVGAGAIAGVGKLGTVKQVSPTLFAQYRFLETDDLFRPYVGLGLTYARFYGEEGSGTLTALTNVGGEPTRLSVESAWGWSPQIGAQYRIDRHWFADFSVIKTYLKTTNHLSTGQSIDVKLNPVSINLSVGYRF